MAHIFRIYTHPLLIPPPSSSSCYFFTLLHLHAFIILEGGDGPRRLRVRRCPQRSVQYPNLSPGTQGSTSLESEPAINPFFFYYLIFWLISLPYKIQINALCYMTFPISFQSNLLVYNWAQYLTQVSPLSSLSRKRWRLSLSLIQSNQSDWRKKQVTYIPPQS